MSNSSSASKVDDSHSISVVMPVFNGANTIKEALDSIFIQSRLPDEIIIVDDGSRDNTLEIARNYSDLVTVIKQDNKGHASARNLGIKHASGKFIAALDADDIWREDKLEKQLKYCATADVIYTGVENFGDCDHVGRETFTDGKCETGDHLCPLLLDNFIVHSSVLMRREAVLSVGGYDLTLKTSPDWDLWLRMADAKMNFHGIPEPITMYRWSSGSNSRNYRQACRDRLRVVEAAITRAEPNRITKPIQKEAIKNAWSVSAWFALNDKPRYSIYWYLRALSIKPFSIRLWIDLVRATISLFTSQFPK